MNVFSTEVVNKSSLVSVLMFLACVVGITVVPHFASTSNK